MQKLKSLAYATGAALAIISGGVHALALPLDGILEDDNKELVIDAQGNLKTSGSLVVGDTLWAVVNFGAVRNSDNSLFSALGAGNALHGISAITIVDITAGVATFGPNATFTGTYGAGAMAALFTSTTPLNLACVGQATCEGAAPGGATNGALWLTAGLGDSSDFWIAGGSTPFSIATDLASIAGLSGATKVAVANFGLSVLTNNTGYLFNEQACPICALIAPASDGTAEIIGSGDVLGGAGLASPYVARSDFDFSFSRVPEPGTMALLGLGLVGLGLTARRRTAA